MHTLCGSFGKRPISASVVPVAAPDRRFFGTARRQTVGLQLRNVVFASRAQQTCKSSSAMSAFGGKADIAYVPKCIIFKVAVNAAGSSRAGCEDGGYGTRIVPSGASVADGPDLDGVIRIFLVVERHSFHAADNFDAAGHPPNASDRLSTGAGDRRRPRLYGL